MRRNQNGFASLLGSLAMLVLAALGGCRARDAVPLPRLSGSGCEESAGDIHWRKAGPIWIAQGQQGAGGEVVRSVNLALRSFARHFASPSMTGVVFDHTLPKAARSCIIRSDAFAWSLPWPLNDSGDTRTQLQDENTAPASTGKMTDAIENKLKTRLGAFYDYLDEAQRAALIRSLAARQAGSFKQRDAPDAGRNDPPFGETGPGFLSHEIGHKLFTAQVWPETRPDAYGSAAPDWLDEVAAILMEDADSANRRRTGFAKLAKSGRLLSLASFFRMVHPVQKQANAAKEAAEKAARDGGVGIGVEIYVRTRDEARDLHEFYAYTRGFADYLLERTGEDRVFLELARHLSAGEDMRRWLSHGRSARAANLPLTLDGLDADFAGWADTQP